MRATPLLTITRQQKSLGLVKRFFCNDDPNHVQALGASESVASPNPPRRQEVAEEVQFQPPSVASGYG